MDAVVFFKEKSRMCKNYGSCARCEIGYYSNGEDMDCATYIDEYPEEAVEIIERWSDEHPRKTMLEDFLEKYPKAMLREDGMPYGTCPYMLGYEEARECTYLSCKTCWNRPLEEGEK